MTDLVPGGALQPNVEQELARLVEAARAALGEDVQAVVLFGSAVEGRLGATSDVNVIFVLQRFEPPRAEALREPLRGARAAVGVSPMFLLASELREATDAFAVKFADVLRRRRVLWGEDPFARLAVPREGQVRQLLQVLLNQALRMRERFVTVGLREEQLSLALADAAGPLRAAAATLLELEGTPVASGREALERVAGTLGVSAWTEALAAMSRARERGLLPRGEAAPAFLSVLAIAERLRERAARLERGAP